MAWGLELGDLLFTVLSNLTHPVIPWLCCHLFRLSPILRSSNQVWKLWPFHSIITVEFSKSSHIVQYYQQNQRSLIQISFSLSVVNSTSGHRLEPVWLLAHCQLKGHLLQSLVWFPAVQPFLLLSVPKGCIPSSQLLCPPKHTGSQCNSLHRQKLLIPSNELNQKTAERDEH